MNLNLEPFVIVIFGASGDLCKRKLMPAMIKLAEQGWLPKQYALVVTSRRPLDTTKFKEQLFSHSTVSPTTHEQISANIHVLTAFDPAQNAEPLVRLLDKIGYQQRLFYAATPPDQFAVIAEALDNGRMLLADSPLVLEKPLGHNLASYRSINQAVVKHVPEHLIYRIDHYLGKETVQNLLCLRFANLIFESLWNRSYIEHVQITVAEQEGCAGRAGYYDEAGAIRDMVQNHLAQLLCLTAMEQPRSYEADAVRDEKLKVLRCLSPISSEDIVIGQYAQGLSNGEKAASYLTDVAKPDSSTETFAVLKVGINNWRWAGVPFYLRTGKRLPVRESLIVVRFKPVPHSLFPGSSKLHNQIVIRLQPNEGVKLQVNNKLPGPGNIRVQPNQLNLNFSDTGNPMPDAYERLLLDALRGNATLYMRDDEVEASWEWIEPALDAQRPQIEQYPAGTWGPDSAQILLAGNGHRWVNPATN